MNSSKNVVAATAAGAVSIPLSVQPVCAAVLRRRQRQFSRDAMPSPQPAAAEARPQVAVCARKETEQWLF